MGWARGAGAEELGGVAVIIGAVGGGGELEDGLYRVQLQGGVVGSGGVRLMVLAKLWERSGSQGVERGEGESLLICSWAGRQ